MFGYYLELAFRNLKRNPGLTALMIGAVALGIAVCVMTLTMYRAMSGNPIWWKNDVLYAVTMDFWDPDEDYFDSKPGLPPQQLTYHDALAVYALRHPEAQGHHAQGGRHRLGGRPAGEAGARADARDDQGLLRGLRRAHSSTAAPGPTRRTPGRSR